MSTYRPPRVVDVAAYICTVCRLGQFVQEGRSKPNPDTLVLLRGNVPSLGPLGLGVAQKLSRIVTSRLHNAGLQNDLTVAARFCSV